MREKEHRYEAENKGERRMGNEVEKGSNWYQSWVLDWPSGLWVGADMGLA